MEFQLIDAVVRSIFEPVIVTDGKGQVLKLNQAAVELLGGTAGGAEVDRGVLATTPGGDKILNAIRAAVSMQRATTAEEGQAALLPMRIGQAERSYRLRTTPMRDSEGKLLGAVTLLEDVTEIAQVDRFKSRFLSVARRSCASRSGACAFPSMRSPRAMPANCDLFRWNSPPAPPRKPNTSTI